MDSMESLTSIVSSALEARGVLAKIRAELRANVFAAIHEEEPPDASAAPPTLAAVRTDPTGQLALQLVHELLGACGLDYTASVFLPEAGTADAEAPNRAALAASLGLPAPAKDGEPLLVSLLRLHLDDRPPAAGGAGAACPAPAPASKPSAGTVGSSSRAPAGGGSSLGALPTLPAGRARGGGGGADISDLPPLGGGMGGGLRGAGGASEEERRLDALESKLAGLAGIQSPGGAVGGGALGGPAEAFGDEIDEEMLEDFEEDFEDDDYEEEGEQTSSRLRFEQSVDESVSPGRLEGLARR